MTGSSTVQLSCSNSGTWEIDDLRVSINLVHLSYAENHFLHIFPPLFTRLIPLISLSLSLQLLAEDICPEWNDVT